MIIPYLHGQMMDVRAGLIRCPFAMHYHAGDEIEVELEMILCEERTNELMNQLKRR